ncbi:MAG: hypothetical protein IIB44_10465 [Candidatus Marinimicrobia bacterium]|nr:hypothetical protein [Candidatus Neomarinimicrobiota bacterium]
MQTVSKKIEDYANDLVPEGNIEFKFEKLIENELIRRLIRFRHVIRLLEKKYGMDFYTFREREVVKQMKYSFEVENDFCDWEMALDGIRTIEGQLKELRRDMNEHKGG